MNRKDTYPYGYTPMKEGDLVRHVPSQRLGVVVDAPGILHPVAWGHVTAKLVWSDNGRSGRKYIEELEIISRAPTT